MSIRNHIVRLFTLIALLLAPFALAPRAAQAATVTYYVDKLTDVVSNGATCADDTPNDCSLRDAITRANTAPVADTKVVSFEKVTNGSIGGTAPFTITLNSILPPITGGNTQLLGEPSNLAGIPEIAIDGNGFEVGLQLTSNNNLIGQFSLYGFTNFGLEPYFGSAIYITGANNRIQTNYLGFAPDGTVPAGKANFSGIRIDGAAATGNIIGGANNGGTAVANYVSGNQQNGIIIREASGNIIQNNIIGLARVGNSLVQRGNGQYGIQVFSLNGTSANNVIGGNSRDLANIIGYNGQAGVLIRGSGTTTTTLQANYIGIDKSSDTTFANLGSGIIVEFGAKGTTIGGSGAALIVGGNIGYGILVRQNGGSSPVNTRIQGNTYIGLNRSGTVSKANTLGGVRIAQGSGTVIDGSGSSLRISGNTGPGVAIIGASSSGTVVKGALIGVSPSGTGTPSGTIQNNNAGGGILVDGASQTEISGNTISSNGLFGVRLSSAVTSTVQGNFIGLDIDDIDTRGNSGPGILVENSKNTLIGGGAAALGNYIAGNTAAPPLAAPSIVISGTGTLSTTVDANVIGFVKNASSDTTYTKAAPSAGEGVLVQNGAKRVVIGGTVGNTIGNTFAQLSPPDAPSAYYPAISLSGVTTATLSLNTIGYLPNGTNPPTAHPTGGGVAISGGSAVEVISNTIRFANGESAGISVTGGAQQIALVGNVIENNGGDAVFVADSTTARVSIRNNQMAGNGGAINLSGTSTYDGTPPDTAAPGPNHDIDPPFNIRVTQAGLISGFVYTSTNKVNLSPVSACVTCTIEVFRPKSDAAPDGQGWERLRIEQNSAAADAIGSFQPNGSFVAQLLGPLPKQLLFAATDGYGNTSEFAVFNANYGLTLTPLTPNPAAQSAAPTQTVTYTLRLANTGTVDLSNITVQSGGTLPNWTVALSPSGQLALAAGATRTLTVSLTLPNGSDPNVQVPKVDTTTITVTSPGLVTDTEQLVTTVLARPVLRVVPPQGNGSGKPGERVTYAHRIYNDGNITVTLSLNIRTIDPADSGKIWVTQLSNTAPVIGPGSFTDVAVNVTVPAAAQERDGQGNPVTATTIVTGTGSAEGLPDLTLAFSDTTRVSLATGAEMFPDAVQNGAAGGQVIFYHTVRNTSNGRATFKLNVQTNFGSQVQLLSDTSGVTVTNNLFTLDNVLDPPAKTNTMRLKVIVTLNESLLPGTTEVVNIFLSDPLSNNSIGGAAVVDRIPIIEGQLLPRVWMPLVNR